MKVKVLPLNYIGHIVECGEVFQTVRLASGTLVIVPISLTETVQSSMRRAILLLTLTKSQLCNSLQEAIRAAGKWHLYVTENEGPLRGEHFLRLDAEGITDVNGLNEEISNWEQKLANELGVSSADQAGFQRRTFRSALSLIRGLAVESRMERTQVSLY